MTKRKRFFFLTFRYCPFFFSACRNGVCVSFVDAVSSGEPIGEASPLQAGVHRKIRGICARTGDGQRLQRANGPRRSEEAFRAAGCQKGKNPNSISILKRHTLCEILTGVAIIFMDMKSSRYLYSTFWVRTRESRKCRHERLRSTYCPPSASTFFTF